MRDCIKWSSSIGFMTKRDFREVKLKLIILSRSSFRVVFKCNNPWSPFKYIECVVFAFYRVFVDLNVCVMFADWRSQMYH